MVTYEVAPGIDMPDWDVHVCVCGVHVCFVKRLSKYQPCYVSKHMVLCGIRCHTVREATTLSLYVSVLYSRQTSERHVLSCDFPKDYDCYILIHKSHTHTHSVYIYTYIHEYIHTYVPSYLHTYMTIYL